MLELAALGLLQREPLHGYRLKQQLELFMSSCISVNYGAIYPLLGRLERRGLLVTQKHKPTGGTGCRKVYAMTPKGRDRWLEKMMEHPHESWVNSRSRFAIKFFFFSDLPPESRVWLLENRLDVCRLRQEAVEAQQLPEDPFQQAVWCRHLSMLRSEVQWLVEYLDRGALSSSESQSLNRAP